MTAKEKLCHISKQTFVHLMACKLLNNTAVTLLMSYHFPRGCGGPTLCTEMSYLKNYIFNTAKQTPSLTFNLHITTSSILDSHLAKLTINLKCQSNLLQCDQSQNILCLPKPVFRCSKKTCTYNPRSFTPSLHSLPLTHVEHLDCLPKA